MELWSSADLGESEKDRSFGENVNNKNQRHCVLIERAKCAKPKQYRRTMRFFLHVLAFGFLLLLFYLLTPSHTLWQHSDAISFSHFISEFQRRYLSFSPLRTATPCLFYILPLSSPPHSFRRKIYSHHVDTDINSQRRQARGCYDNFSSSDFRANTRRKHTCFYFFFFRWL